MSRGNLSVGQEQQCGLHLFDLVRAHPRHPAAPQAWALLEEHRARGAVARQLQALRRHEAMTRNSPPPEPPDPLTQPQ
jgi:hypothetical protein